MQEMCRGAKEKAAVAATTYGSCQCLADHWRFGVEITFLRYDHYSRFFGSGQGKNIDRLLSSHRRSEG